MTDAAKNVSDAARALSAEHRLRLVENLLESLAAPDEAIDRLWAKEAEDRLAAYRRGEIEASGLSEILAKYRAS